MGVQSLVRVVLVAALAVTGLASTVQAETSSGSGTEPSARAGLPAAPVRPSEPVELPELTTEDRVVHRQPDGTTVATMDVEPVRVRRDDRWIPVDTTLIRRADGTIGPRAIPSDLTFSPGGGAPLVNLARSDKQVGLTWPGTLPEPVLVGNRATYAEVLPGVDLVMAADAKGYTQRLVIKTPDAARNPALASIRFGLTTKNVQLRTEADGALRALDAAGTPVFEATPPAMWDSPKQNSRAAARQAPIAVALTADSMTLVPNRALLTAPDATFPITIDPDMKTYSRSGWTKVFKGKPDSTHWNGANDVDTWAKVGYCGWRFCNGLEETRSYFQFDTGSLSGDILSVQLRSTIVHSPDCGTSSSHQLFRATDPIGAGTTWRNKPAGLAKGRATVPHVYGGCTGYKSVGFDAQGSVNTTGVSTYYIAAVNESDEYAWRKYKASDTKLQVTYNHAPRTPANRTTDPKLPTACHWCAGVRYVGAGANLRLLSTLSDQNGDYVRPLWRYYVNGTATDRWGTFRSSGTTHTTSLSLSGMNGKQLSWKVQAWDRATNGSNLASSAWADGPGPFVVDQNPPDRQPAVRGVLYQQDGRWHGGTSVPDYFTFDSAGVADINHFEYHWTGGKPQRVIADKLGGKAVVKLTPPVDGTVTLHVRSFDRAGNPSGNTEYVMRVRPGNGPAAHWQLNGNAKDSAFPVDVDGEKTGTPHGDADYGPGASGLGLRVNGAGFLSARAKQSEPVNLVRTDTSFTVSAWVRPTGGTGAQSAVSQLGDLAPGFGLWRRPDANGVYRWAFGIPRNDTADAAVDLAWSHTEAVTSGPWTHLTGVYDATRGTVTLFVNGVQHGVVPRAGKWNSTGELRVGNSRWNGTDTDHWIGDIDDVRLWDRGVDGAEIAALVRQDDVVQSHWRFDDPAETGGVANTTALNEIDGGPDAVLLDGARLSAGSPLQGAVRLDGTDDSVSTHTPVVRTDQSFSVVATVNLGRTDVPQAVLSQDGARATGIAIGYHPVGTSQGRWTATMAQSDVDNPQVIQAVTTAFPRTNLSPDSWYHLAATYEVTTGRLMLYVNGEVATTTGTRTGTPWPANGALRLGRTISNGGPGSYLSGKIDEVRVYGRAIDAAEVRGLVKHGGMPKVAWALDGTTDATTSGQHGVAVGIPGWSAGQSDDPDPSDLAVRLNGKDQFVEAPNTVNTAATFSVTAWAKLDQLGGHRAVVSQDGTTTSSFRLEAGVDGSRTRWMFTRYTADNGGVPIRVLGPDVQLNTWTHLVGVYSRERGVLELYVNGVGSSTTYPSTQAWNSTGKLTIGVTKYGGARGHHLAGSVDDVATYERALFPDEITELAGRELALEHNWRLDEPSGTLAADGVGGRGSTLRNGAAFAPGRVGNAVDLDGVDDHASTAGIDLAVNRSFTVSAWVYLDAKRAPSTMTAVSVDGGAQSTFRLGHVVDDTDHYCVDDPWDPVPNACGAWVFELPSANGTGAKAALSTTNAEIDRWVHLVGVYDQPNKQLWLYVDGSRVADGTLNAPWQPGEGALQIGRAKAAGAYGEYWDGKVDDVRMYAGTLSKGRVSGLFHSYLAHDAPSDPSTSIAAKWDFDEGTDSTAHDTSGKEEEQLRPVTLTDASWVGGRVTSATWLNGSSAFGETEESVVDTSRGFAVGAWVYVSDPGTTNRTVLSQDAATRSGFSLQYDATAKKWAAHLPVTDTAGSTVRSLRSSQQARTEEWTHVAVSYDANLEQLRLYVNGVLSAASVGVRVIPAPGRFGVGRAMAGGVPTDLFRGALDDIRVYQSPLGDADARAIHDDAHGITHSMYRFDDGSGRDYAWRGNSLAFSGGATTADGGIDGKALRLSGTARAASTLPGVSTQDSFTVSAWTNLTSRDPAANATLISQGASTNAAFALQYRGGQDRWTFSATTQDTTGAPVVSASSTAPPLLNQWTHLVGVYDHPARQLRLYVNGVLQDYQDNVSMVDAPGGLVVGRGKVDGAFVEYYQGWVDEVHVGQGELTDTDIARRATAPAAATGQLGQYVNAAGDRATASTDQPPAGYRFEATLGMPAPADAPGTVTLHSCRTSAGDTFTTTVADCGGYESVGSIGPVYATPPPDVATVPIHRCNTGPDHFDSLDGTCAGTTREFTLGYALAFAPMSRYNNPTAYDYGAGISGDHWSSVDGAPPGYVLEVTSGFLPLSDLAGTVPLHSCLTGVDQFLSTDESCAGGRRADTVGRVFSDAPPNEIMIGEPLYRCTFGSESFMSQYEDCEGQQSNGSVGYLLSVPPGRPDTFVN